MALEGFEKLHPSCLALFCFDQTSNYQALPDHALTIKNLALSDRPAKEFMRRGWFECHGRIVEQAITYPDDYSIASKRGMRKGMRTILEERGMWIEDMKLDYKNKLGQIDSTRQPDCCAIYRLSQLPDFLIPAFKTGKCFGCHTHLFSMYAKFHCSTISLKEYGARRSDGHEMNANIRLQC
jgi:hypothetical protein